ncbi:MAG: alpha/beta fold hydrolase, partial [Candidatus Eremiobacteraeota bacterium]|nr:alpha/beta fold hydrolase [Candidatus Eremiobacteraeota bacterium]
MSVEEFELQGYSGTLAAKRRRGGELPVLALHGWLDNAGTFDGLASHLQGLDLVCLDLPGHGHSYHRPAGTPYHFVDWVPEVFCAAKSLGWERFVLMGHSMGAGIASLAAGTFPERIEKLILIEGIGPFASPDEEAPLL